MSRLVERLENLDNLVLYEDVDTSYIGLPESEKVVDDKYYEVINQIEDTLNVKFEKRENLSRFCKWRAEAKIEDGNHTITIDISRELPDGIYNNSYVIVVAQDTEKMNDDKEIAPGLVATCTSKTKNIGKPYSYGIWKGKTPDEAQENRKLEELIDAIKSAIGTQRGSTLDESKVTDYIDVDRLGEIIIHNPILKNFNDCEPIEGMVLKMTSDMGVSYYKVIKNDDGSFEAYWIDKSGKALGDPFLLESASPDYEDEPLMNATPETKIKDWYASYAPDDYQLDEINAKTTFQDIKNGINKYSIESLIGPVDSDVINTIINATCDACGIKDAYEFSRNMSNDRPAFK